MYLLTNFPSQYLLIMQDLPVLASPIDINFHITTIYFQENLVTLHFISYFFECIFRLY